MPVEAKRWQQHQYKHPAPPHYISNRTSPVISRPTSTGATVISASSTPLINTVFPQRLLGGPAANQGRKLWTERKQTSRGNRERERDKQISQNIFQRLTGLINSVHHVNVAFNVYIQMRRTSELFLVTVWVPEECTCHQCSPRVIWRHYLRGCISACMTGQFFPRYHTQSHTLLHIQ